MAPASRLTSEEAPSPPSSLQSVPLPVLISRLRVVASTIVMVPPPTWVARAAPGYDHRLVQRTLEGLVRVGRGPGGGLLLPHLLGLDANVVNLFLVRGYLRGTRRTVVVERRRSRLKDRDLAS